MILRSRGTCCLPTPPQTGAAHPSRTVRRAGLHNPISLRIWQAPQLGRPRRQPYRKPSQNLVIPSGERSSARRMILRSRGTCCLSAPSQTGVPHSSRTLRRVGFHSPIPLRIWQAPRPGRARLQCVPQASKEMQPVILGQAQFPRQASRENRETFSRVSQESDPCMRPSIHQRRRRRHEDKPDG